MCALKSWQVSRVLVADDGSEHAQAAVQLLCDLHFARDISLTVLRAFPSTQAAETYTLEAQLQNTCRKLEAAGYSPGSELVLGSAAEKIIHFVSDHHPDLILLGAKGLRATLGILLGGVAQQVVEYACCPTLIVRAPYHGLHRVLLVTDGSAYSLDAIEYLAGFPLPVGLEIDLMHVLSPPAPPYIPIEPGYMGQPISQPIPVTEEDAERRKHDEQTGEKLLDAAVEKLADPKRNVTKILKQGDAATEIIEYVKTNDIDLIVTGSRGLSQMKAWLLGSVSRKLVHYSNCSVLVVRRPDHQEIKNKQ